MAETVAEILLRVHVSEREARARRETDFTGVVPSDLGGFEVWRDGYIIGFTDTPEQGARLLVGLT